MSKKITSFQDLFIWKKAYRLTKNIYKATDKLYQLEDFSISLSLRQSSQLVNIHIAKGFHKQTTKAFIYSLYRAQEYLYESINYLILLYDLQYIEKKRYSTISKEMFSLSKILVSSIQALELKPATSLIEHFHQLSKVSNSNSNTKMEYQ